MGVKEFFSGLFSTEKEERMSELLVALHEKTRECKSLSEDVERLKNIVKNLEHKSGYFVGKTDDGFESGHIYGDSISFYDDKYVFYRNGKCIGVLSSDTYKELILVQDEEENEN